VYQFMHAYTFSYAALLVPPQAMKGFLHLHLSSHSRLPVVFNLQLAEDYTSMWVRGLEYCQEADLQLSGSLLLPPYWAALTLEVVSVAIPPCDGLRVLFVVDETLSATAPIYPRVSVARMRSRPVPDGTTIMHADGSITPMKHRVRHGAATRATQAEPADTTARQNNPAARLVAHRAARQAAYHAALYAAGSHQATAHMGLRSSTIWGLHQASFDAGQYYTAGGPCLHLPELAAQELSMLGAREEAAQMLGALADA
jgi:hypothetical protein